MGWSVRGLWAAPRVFRPSGYLLETGYGPNRYPHETPPWPGHGLPWPGHGRAMAGPWSSHGGHSRASAGPWQVMAGPRPGHGTMRRPKRASHDAGKGQRAKGRGQRAKGKGQRAEGRGQRAKGKGQRAKGKGQRATFVARRSPRLSSCPSSGTVFSRVADPEGV